MRPRRTLDDLDGFTMDGKRCFDASLGRSALLPVLTFNVAFCSCSAPWCSFMVQLNKVGTAQFRVRRVFTFHSPVLYHKIFKTTHYSALQSSLHTPVLFDRRLLLYKGR